MNEEKTVNNATANTEPANTDPKPSEGTPTLEELAKQIASLKADNVKLKATNDKVMTENGGLRKSLREKQTAEEAAAQERADAEAKREEHYKEIEKELAIAKKTKKFMALGFSEEDAGKAAEASYDGDEDYVFTAFQTRLNDATKKAADEKAEELMKSMPNPQSGNSTDVDYNKRFTDAMASGNGIDAVGAILDQFKATHN